MAQPSKARDDLGSDSEVEDDKELRLTEYDKKRKMVPIIRGRSIVMNTKILSTELTCPICLDLLTNTMTTKDCLHRFCNDCILMALQRGNKECPTCRTKLASKRSLRHDTNFDELIKKIWPDRQKFEEMLGVANEDGDDPLSSIVAFADEEEEKRDHANMYDPFDKDAPTPPALLDSRRTTSPMEMYDEGGRRTPPWFTVGTIKPEELDNHEKMLYMQAQRAYLKLKSRRLGARIAGLDRIFDCDVTTETYSKTSRETTSPPHEPHAKNRKLNNGGSKKASQSDNRDDGKSVASSADSGPDSDSDYDAATIEAELDKDDMEELDMMDPNLFLVQTSKELPRKAKKERKENTEAPPVDQPGTSNGMNYLSPADNPNLVRPEPIMAQFDPRRNEDPPYPDALENFAELMPNTKIGATWQSAIDNPMEQQEDDLDEELVFEEDDVLSVVSIDDMLKEMETAAHEDEVEVLYTERKPEGVFSDLSRDNHEDKDSSKYMCEETRMHLREINELRAGCLGDIKASLDETEQFDMGEATTWYSQTRDGEEMVYYEKSKQPISRARQHPVKIYDVDEEVERLGRRVTIKEIRDDMSNTDTDQGTPCTLSLASSPASSKLTLSDIHEEESKEEPPVVDLPVLNPGQVKERLHRWIGDVTPNTPEQLDTPLDRSTVDDEDDDDCESLPENYEIETELRPSAALLSRPVPAEVLQTRFIRSQHHTTVEHIGEFLYQRWLEEVNERTDGEDASNVPRPEHFYVFNRTDRNCKCVLSHEPLVTAQTLTARDDHVVIYFDTQRAEISDKEKSLLEKIVPQKDRAEQTPSSSRESTGSSSSR
ncbi:hypothetical protein PENTCL1PPCAC_29776 [Pristionchus entomophagus]|uniref:RING-type E3 ubiquitin transferase n=1 Tax=Pristionchus entomophagus TaxID=358040 RepID=A0AAV5UMT1_9BILA|nr:hypothetical protein PENTCL1PPCAC_29776 [Pristionchus entomophagus]